MLYVFVCKIEQTMVLSRLDSLLLFSSNWDRSITIYSCGPKKCVMNKNGPELPLLYSIETILVISDIFDSGMSNRPKSAHDEKKTHATTKTVHV